MGSVGQIAVTALGIIGLSGILAALNSSRRLSRHHRFFRFQFREPVDFVLTTSSREYGGFGGVKYKRPTTAVGNLRGATEIAQAIGYGSPRRPITVGVSTDLESSLRDDLVVLGLPGKNVASGLVFRELAARYPNLKLAIEESKDPGCSMGLGAASFPYEVVAQRDSEIPETDIAVIVMWVNPFSLRKRRLLLCGGFTAYGTAAAARYLIHDVLNHRLSSLRREHQKLPSLWGSDWVCFAMLIELRLIHDQIVKVRELAFEPLADPGAPPFSGSAGDERDKVLRLRQVPDEGAPPGDDAVELG
jgi:hypothetical protein